MAHKLLRLSWRIPSEGFPPARLQGGHGSEEASAAAPFVSQDRGLRPTPVGENYHSIFKSSISKGCLHVSNQSSSSEREGAAHSHQLRRRPDRPAAADAVWCLQLRSPDGHQPQ